MSTPKNIDECNNITCSICENIKFLSVRHKLDEACRVRKRFINEKFLMR